MVYIITDDHVRGARVLLSPQYKTMSDQDVRNYLYQRTCSVPAEDAEGFLDQLTSIAKTVGQVALQAAPTIAPILGGAVGGLVGGPAGAQIGSTLGKSAAQFATNVAAGQSPG